MGADINFSALGKLCDGSFIADIQPLFQSQPGDGAVHYTRIEIQVSQYLG